MKVVRETMNRAMELWKGVPGVSDEVSDEAESKSSVKGQVPHALVYFSIWDF